MKALSLFPHPQVCLCIILHCVCFQILTQSVNNKTLEILKVYLNHVTYKKLNNVISTEIVSQWRVKDFWCISMYLFVGLGKKRMGKSIIFLEKKFCWSLYTSRTGSFINWEMQNANRWLLSLKRQDFLTLMDHSSSSPWRYVFTCTFKTNIWIF